MAAIAKSSAPRNEGDAISDTMKPELAKNVEMSHALITLDFDQEFGIGAQEVKPEMRK